MAEDYDNVFYDTLSISSLNSVSTATSKRSYIRNSIALSRSTVYHSAEDLELLALQMDDALEYATTHINHNGASNDSNSTIVTSYTQWKNRNWNRFRDGEKTVDFVLAYRPSDQTSHEIKRRTFENHLNEEGLALEREETQQKYHFVKIHAPKEILCRYCEILKLRMPMKNLPGQDMIVDETFEIASLFNKLPQCFSFVQNFDKFPRKKYRLTCEFSRDKNYLFEVDADEFFSSSVKSMIIDFILKRTRFNDELDAVFDVGIAKLLDEGIYDAAYPLHDGDHRKEGTQRNLLFKEWAQISKWMYFQPIDYIKDYFGVQHALYFAWLGFYTQMLIPASIFGVVCFTYGLLTLSQDTFSRDICDDSLNITMCPLCDRHCDYWKLTDSCFYSKVSYLIDNSFTLAFAVFMSVWAALYLELWKRYSADITHRWGLAGYDVEAEHPRPQYLAKLARSKKRKLNVVTRVLEPSVPFWKIKFPSIILSYSVAVLWIMIALAAVFGVVIYRMAQIASRSLYDDIVKNPTTSKILSVPVTAAVINLICIYILNIIYDKLAVVLTEMEYQRTQTEFDNSLSLKIYMFQFVNYYSSIFYIAFLKGKWVGYPKKYNRIFGLRQEECNPGGCLMELCVQLTVIMIGNQALAAILEMIVPLLTKWYNSFFIKYGITEDDNQDDLICCNQWTEDYKLNDWGSQSLFYEYLEMVLQYGFITVFVTAFPLAPLFALINNIFEMRLDANKFLKYFRRPVPCNAKNIGVWLPILGIVSRIAIVSNALIIAFSSNFIPRLVYRMSINPEHNDEGFLAFTLAYFNTKDFQQAAVPLNTTLPHLEVCRYSEFRNPPHGNSGVMYKRPLVYWQILAARLAFVVIFQNLVGFAMTSIQWAIPDMSSKLKNQIKRENYLTSEIIIKQEALRARSHSKSPPPKRDFVQFKDPEPSSQENEVIDF